MKTIGKFARLTVCACLILAFCLALCGCDLFKKPVEEDPLDTDIKVQYTMYTVTRGDIVKSFAGMCAVTPMDTVKLSYEFGGYPLEKYELRSGAKVQPGDVICRVRTEDVEADLTRLNQAIKKASGSQKAELQKQKENAEKVLNNAELKAPVSGTVRYINTKFTIGSDKNRAIVPGETMAVIEPDSMANVLGVMNVEPEEDAKFTMGVRSQVTVSLTVPGSLEKKSFPGEIVGTSKQVGNNGVDYVVYYIDLSNAPENVKVGDRLSVGFTEDEASYNCLTIPSSALYDYNNRYFVYVLDSQGLRRECYVEVGLRSEHFVEIKSGLSEGQQIIQR